MTADRIVVLGTGGTIAGEAASADDHVGYRAGQLGVQELLALIPALAGLPLASEQVANIDSKDMGVAVWQALAARCAHWLAQPDVQGIVVTHGTDTLEETAWLLQRVLAPAKPVVLASAMRPATALVPDGPQNLVDAISVARTPGARGVTAVCAGTLHAAADVRKAHPYRLDAFSSGDAGPLGFVEDGRLRLVREWPAGEAVAGALQRLRQVAGDGPRVAIVTSHAGVDARVVDLLVADGVRGLVVAATGNGTVHECLEHAAVQAAARGVRVVRATRCVEGQVVGQGGELPASTLSPVKARIDLWLELLAA